jgi:hypothetical protein
VNNCEGCVVTGKIVVSLKLCGEIDDIDMGRSRRLLWVMDEVVSQDSCKLLFQSARKIAFSRVRPSKIFARSK